MRRFAKLAIDIATALSGHAEPRFKQAADEAGFDLFAVKPWDIEQMRAVLRTLHTARRRTSSE